MKANESIRQENQNKKYLWSLLFLGGIVGITFWVFLKDHDLNQLGQVIRSANPWYILLGLVCMLGFIACEALSVKAIMSSFGERIPFRRSYKYAFIAFYYSSITPAGSGGQPMQLYHMKRDGYRFSHGSLTILLLVSVYQVAELIYALAVFCIKPNFLMAHTGKISVLILYGVIFNLVVLTLILCAVFSKRLVPKFLGKATGWLIKLRFVKQPQHLIQSAQQQIEEYQQGAAHIRKYPAVLCKVMLFTLLQLTCQFMVPFFVYRAFGLNQYGFLEIVAMQSVLILAVGSLPIPGAVGASESGFMILYRVFFASSQLLPAMMLSRGISFYGMLLISGTVAAVAQLLPPARQFVGSKIPKKRRLRWGKGSFSNRLLRGRMVIRRYRMELVRCEQAE
ncbi:MAG: lysylphosphatidylglycerol synthase transmembrane domain-containing protein [Massiliimalia sp.]|jgi:uncharacterized protein (TIRG00374 family)